MSKGLKITLIVILSIIAVAIIAFIIFALTKKSFRFFTFVTKEYKELALEESYDNNYEKITINSKAGKIYIKTTDDEKIKVLIYSEKDDAKVENNEKELKIINNSDGCKGFCFKQTIAKIEVYIPSTYANEINVENNFGDIEIADFENVTLKINEDAGNIEIGKIKDGNIKNSAGNIELKSANNIVIDEEAGNVEIGEVTNKIKVDLNAGNIEVEKLYINENSEITNNLGNIEIKKTNSIKIEAHTDLGGLKVNGSNSDSEITLKVDNNCGNIEIN